MQRTVGKIATYWRIKNTFLKKIHAKKCTIFKFSRQKIPDSRNVTANFFVFKKCCAKSFDISKILSQKIRDFKKFGPKNSLFLYA